MLLVGRKMRMKDFEDPPLEDCKKLVDRLRGKSVEGIIDILGQPVRVAPGYKESRRYSRHIETIEFLRVVEFRDVTTTIHRFLVFERVDGKLEMNFRGRTLKEANAALP